MELRDEGDGSDFCILPLCPEAFQTLPPAASQAEGETEAANQLKEQSAFLPTHLPGLESDLPLSTEVLGAQIPPPQGLLKGFRVLMFMLSMLEQQPPLGGLLF